MTDLNNTEAGKRSLFKKVGYAVLGLLIFRLLPGTPPRAVARRAENSGSASPPSKSTDTSLAEAKQSGRGREAESPTEIPALGWKDIGLRAFDEMNRHRLLAVAGGVAYFGLLALFPAIAALVAIYGLFADRGTINDHLAALYGLFPAGAVDVIGEQVKRIASKGNTTLGFAFFFGLVISLWSANSGMKALFDALNVAYGEDEKRSFISLNLLTLLFTIGSIVFVLAALGAIVVIPALLSLMGFGDLLDWLLWAARWPALLVAIVVVLAIVYRFGPSRKGAQWRWITPGSLLAAFFWVAFSMLFSWYVANFGNYNETYGSLGAVIGFMTWMWLSVLIILVGAELNAELEHQTAKDTTIGAEKPIGSRGAHVADTIGAARG